MILSIINDIGPRGTYADEHAYAIRPLFPVYNRNRKHSIHLLHPRKENQRHFSLSLRILDFRLGGVYLWI